MTRTKLDPKKAIPISLDTNPKYRPDLFKKEFNSNLRALTRILNKQQKGWGTKVKSQILNLEFGVSDIKQILTEYKPCDRYSLDCIKGLLVDCMVDSKTYFKLEFSC